MDSLENLLLLQLALHEVFCCVSEDVNDLVRRMESGFLYPPIELVWRKNKIRPGEILRGRKIKAFKARKITMRTFRLSLEVRHLKGSALYGLYTILAPM